MGACGRTGVEPKVEVSETPTDGKRLHQMDGVLTIIAKGYAKEAAYYKDG